MSKKKDMNGQKFGTLLVLKESSERMKDGRVKWDCLCDCGSTTNVDGKSLRNGHTQSCGCQGSRATIGERSITHNNSYHPLYRTWQRMRFRCFNPKNIDYPNYGGRGISVCEEWKNSFNIFLQDMGNKPSEEYSIERIDVNGNYCKENCRWANHYDQANNTTSTIWIEYNGEKMCLSDWADICDMSPETLRYRIKSGWSIEKALTRPVRTIKEE